MARRYVSIGAQNAAADTSVLGVTSAATIRPILYELIFGNSAIPADNAFLMYLQRYTDPGTGTSVTPHGLDPADPAAIAAAKQNHSAEPTYTAGSILMNFSLNQQATFRWVVPPDKGLVLPATASYGAGLKFSAVSGGTASAEASIYHEE